MLPLPRWYVRWTLRRRWRGVLADDTHRRQQIRTEINAITVGAIEEMARVVAAGRNTVDSTAEEFIDGDAVDLDRT